MSSLEAVRICLWSGPRNISTALMYSFAQRSDTRIYDEPLYAHYLSCTGARSYHPGAECVIATMDSNGARVVRNLILGPAQAPVLFFKQMTHHLVELDMSFLDKTENVILTRNPEDMLPSYAKKVEIPDLQDVGYAQHLELLHHLRDRGRPPVVLDSRETLSDPRAVLIQLCAALGIEFEDSMLSWPEGPRPEDGVWAEHWYENVHRSTGFQPYEPKAEPFPEALRPLLEKCRPLYEQLAAIALCSDRERTPVTHHDRRGGRERDT
ncbi:MAG: sulfotransferase family protein [Candidatus Latescibacterota bacterium]|nr:sulfotransferase family protein [Candidatus Latescibacterota bacterium]